MAAAQKEHDYHLIDPSPWPLVGALSAMIMFVGLVLTMHDKPHGSTVLLGGLLAVLSVMYVWWRDVVKEGKNGDHTSVVRHGLRIGMALFLVSEVMFFFAFFWGFFKAALDPVLIFSGGEHVLDSGIEAVRGVWPPEGIKTFYAWDLPFINTLILLLSGCTVTWAHYALLNNNRRDVIKALAITVFLGVSFTLLQAVEYMHAEFCMSGLFDALMAKLGLITHEVHHCEVNASHVYPSTFFMATGFHGAHVIIGTIFLTTCLVRAAKGQFSKTHHLGFEFAAWYWHFVDVIWIFLFVFVYVWGA